MKKLLSVVAILFLMAASFVVGMRHTARQTTRETNPRRVLYWVDPMHPDFKSDHPGVAPDCGMQLEPIYSQDVSAPASATLPTALGAVGIDAEKQQLFGIRVTPVARISGNQTQRFLGRVVPEDTRVYKINSGMEGFIRETYNDSVGELVKKDQKLATYYGADSLAVESGFLAATAGVAGATGKDGARTVPFPGAVSKQGVSSLQGYMDRLRNLGISEVQIQEMAESRLLPESVNVVSPVEGFIVTRNITPGEHFDRSMEFYRIADLSQVWILADVTGSEGQNFRPGTVARVTLPNGGRTFTARVSNTLPQVDPMTRTLKLRLEAENPAFALRPDMFVDVELPVASAGLTVPLDALVDSGREQRVYVERANGVFEPRPVQIGWRRGDRVEIVQGLTEGERVVTSGTFLVDSESRLRSVQPAPKTQPRDGEPAKSTEPHIAVSEGRVKDAACGMSIESEKAVAQGNAITRDGVTYYFCSDRCKRNFAAQPEHYLALNPPGSRP